MAATTLKKSQSRVVMSLESLRSTKTVSASDRLRSKAEFGAGKPKQHQTKSEFRREMEKDPVPPPGPGAMGAPAAGSGIGIDSFKPAEIIRSNHTQAVSPSVVIIKGKLVQTNSMKLALKKESNLKKSAHERRHSKNVEEIVEDLMRDTAPNSMFDLTHCDDKSTKDCTRFTEGKKGRSKKSKRFKWNETSVTFFRPFLKKDDMLSHHIEYEVEHPVRVSVRLEYLMGHTTAYLNDMGYVYRLHQAIKAEEERIHDQVIALREEKEKSRVRKLALDGLMEPPPGMEDLGNHPIFKVNRMLAAMSKLEAVYKERREPIDGKITPVEPFEFDNTGNYFIQLHEHGSMPNYVPSDPTDRDRDRDRDRISLDSDSRVGGSSLKSLGHKSSHSHKKRKTTQSARSQSKSKYVTPTPSAVQFSKENVARSRSIQESGLDLPNADGETGVSSALGTRGSAVDELTPGPVVSLTWDQKEKKERREKFLKMQEKEYQERSVRLKQREKYRKAKESDIKQKMLAQGRSTLKDEAGAGPTRSDSIVVVYGNGSENTEGENSDYAGIMNPSQDQLFSGVHNEKLKRYYGSHESSIIQKYIEDAPDAKTLFKHGRELTDMFTRENYVADDFVKELNKLISSSVAYD